MSQDEELTPYEDMIPEGGFPMQGFRLLTYTDEEGSFRFKMSNYGEGSLSHVLGMLEIAKAKLIFAHEEMT